jgi:hypothetical protein
MGVHFIAVVHAAEMLGRGGHLALPTVAAWCGPDS